MECDKCEKKIKWFQVDRHIHGYHFCSDCNENYDLKDYVINFEKEQNLTTNSKGNSQNQSKPTSSKSKQSAYNLDDLEKLADFRERGILTENEFKQKKKQILELLERDINDKSKTSSISGNKNNSKDKQITHQNNELNERSTQTKPNNKRGVPFKNSIIGFLILFAISFVIGIFSHPYEVTNQKIDNAVKLMKNKQPNAAIHNLNIAMQNIKQRDEFYGSFIKVPQLILGRKVPSLKEIYYLRAVAYYGRGLLGSFSRNSINRACEDWKKAAKLGSTNAEEMVEKKCY